MCVKECEKGKEEVHFEGRREGNGGILREKEGVMEG